MFKQVIDGIALACMKQIHKSEGRLQLKIEKGESKALALVKAISERVDGLKLAKGDPGKDGSDGADGVGIDGDIWAPGVYRKGSNVQHNIGQHFRAACDTAEVPGMGDGWERIGKSGFRFLTKWDDETDLQDGDLYVRNFGTLMHMDGHVRVVAGRGVKGQRGERGERGMPGDNGAPGSIIKSITSEGFTIIFTYEDGGETKRQVIDFTDKIEAIVKDMVNKHLRKVLD